MSSPELFSATDPQAPPLLTVNVTAPIGLRFEGASPGAIVNAGNLTANEGQHLTLAAGTVASTGLLAAPGGEVAVVSVPGASADGIPTVQLGEAGQFLDWALEPLPVSSAAAAPDGVSLPDLLAGDATTGLTVNAAGEVELAASGLAVAAGDVTVQQLGAGAATLSAAGNLTLVESQLGTTGDLQLLAKDTVQVQDSATNPFIAAAGGELLVQGDRSVDIFALNHGSSGLFSGGDMTLRSAETVNGDAHYWSGGSFQIEQLDGSPGGLFSPHDPIIRSQGDVRFNIYIGSSLHILAGGQVDIGTAVITGTDTLADTINPTATPVLANVTLSDSTPLIIDGNAQPTLDIRAGMEPSAIGTPLGTEGTNFPADRFLGIVFSIVPPPLNNTVATSTAITIGNILINESDGLVFLTNQYQPDLSLPAGDITITGTGVFGIGGIDASGSGGPGSAVTLDSRRDINLSSSMINSVTDVGDAGDINLIANQGIFLADASLIDSSTLGTGKGGDIKIKAKALSLNQGSRILATTLGAGMGGNLAVDTSESIYLLSTSADGQFRSGLFTETTGKGNTGNLSINTQHLLVRDGAVVSTGTFGDGVGGSLTVDAAESVQLIGNSGLFTRTLGKGDAGPLTIDTQQLLVSDGAQVSTSTFSDGAGGSLSVEVAELVQLIGTSADGQFRSALFTSTEGQGDAGRLTIDTRQLLVRDGAVVSTSSLGDGAGGSLSVEAAESVQLIGTSADGQVGSALLTLTTGKGDAGDLAIGTQQLLVQGGSLASASTSGDGAGGNLSVEAAELVQLIGTSPDSRFRSGLFTETERKGNAGSLTIGTQQLLVRDGAGVSTGTFGAGSGGSLRVDATESVQLIGTSPDSRFSSGLFTETEGEGNAGNLTIGTELLLVQDGAQVSTSTFSDGAGGSLTVEADELVQLIGTSSDSRFRSGLFTETEGKGNAGSLTIGTRKLLVHKGAGASTGTFGDGAGGSLRVDTTESVQLIGTSSDGQFSSALLTITTEKGDAGDLAIGTQQLLVRDGAQVSTSSLGDGAGGNLRVDAAESIQLIGISLDDRFPSGLFTTIAAKGDAGRLIIDTQKLLVRDGAQISARTLGDGAGGRLKVDAAELVQLIGTSPDGHLSGLFADTTGQGSAGSLTLNTRQLLIQDGAVISTGTLGDGMGGSLEVDATELVQLIGSLSALSTQTGGKGDAGPLTIETQKLLIQDGAVVSASTLSDGAGGSLSVNATELVQVSGISLDEQSPSSLLTLTEGKGDAGPLTIETQKLLVRDGAQVSTSTLGAGAGGSLSVDADELVQLIGTSDGDQFPSGLFARTAGKANAGNLTIDTRQLLVQDGAFLSTRTFGAGAGGSLSVDADELVQLIGTSDEDQFNSALLTETVGKGNAGYLSIDTSKLWVQDGAVVSSSTFSDGTGGNLSVNAAELVQLTGTSPDGRVSSGLFARTSGKGDAGRLTIDTRQLLVRDGAQVSTSTFSDGAGGSLSVNAAELVQLTGTSPDGQFNSALLTLTEGDGNAGNLIVDTQKLVVQDGATISASTFSDGAGGSLSVNATALVQLIGNRGLFASTAGKGDAGRLTINTRQLLVRDGAQVSTSTFSDGAGGSLSVNAAESVQLIGTSPDGQFRSALLTLTTGKGDAGRLTIDTRQLLVRDGAVVSTSSLGDGAGGSLSVEAAESVQLIGTSPDGQVGSALLTLTTGKGDAGDLAIGTRQLLVQDGSLASASTSGDGAGGNLKVNADDWVWLIGTSPDGQLSSGLFAFTAGDGKGGSLNVTTGALLVRDGAGASVSGIASGNAGNIGVTARSIFLDNGVGIFAQTASGQGGNITLNVADLLLLRRGSQISTTAGTAQAGGDGGNITIDAGFVVAVPGENSDIFANAFTGRGGNINITANGIFGLKFRPFLTEFSDITASSQFGVDGTVQLNTLGIDPSRGLGLLPTEPTTLQVAESCRTRSGEVAVEFFDVGSGGLPPRPDEPLGNTTIIADLIPLDDGIEALTDSAAREPLISPFSIDASDGVDAATRWAFCQQAAASL